MRAFLVIAALGSVLGVGGAFLLRALRTPPARPLCTASSLHLAPTLGLSPDGKKALLGFSAPGPAECVVPNGAPTSVRLEVHDTHGKLLLARSGSGTPPPGALISHPLVFSVQALALPLCRAAQPLRIAVSALGLSVSGDSRLERAPGRCRLPG